MPATPPIFLRLNDADNVIVARTDILAGTPVERVTARDPMPAGHKIATIAIAEGQPVRKYNQIIGFASQPIQPGEHVHGHNCAMADFDRDYAIGQDAREVNFLAADERATFQGYRRASGQVGTRNYLGILTSVNCSASAARFIAQAVQTDHFRERFPHIDGVVALTHSTGCGMAGAGEGYDNLQRVLWGHARHPNFGGVLMVGLGCEVNQIDFLLEAYGIERGPRFQTMNIQNAGGTRKTVEWGKAALEEMAPSVNEARRETVDASHLSVALQCGGSDGYSGITANPALGFGNAEFIPWQIGATM